MTPSGLGFQFQRARRRRRRALLHEYESSVHLPRPSDCHDPIANEAGRPNSVIRFKMLHAIDASIS